LYTGRHAIVNEGIHVTRFFGGNVLLYLEVFDFTGKGGRESAGVKFSDSRYTGLAGQ
jgi:hypothetical protein